MAKPVPLREIALSTLDDLYVFGSNLWFPEGFMIRCLDLETGADVIAIETSGLSLRATQALLASGAGCLQLTDHRGKKLRAFAAACDGRETSVDAIDDAGTLAVGTHGDALVLWNPRTGKEMRRHELGFSSNVTVSPDGTHIAVHKAKKPLMLVDPSTLERRSVAGTVLTKTPKVAWAPASTGIVAVAKGNVLVIVDAKRGVVKATLKVARISSLAFVPRRTRLVVVGGAGLTVIDTEAWVIVGEVPIQTQRVVASSDGDRLVTSDFETIKVWDAAEVLGGARAPTPAVGTVPVANAPRPAPIRGLFFSVAKTVKRSALLDAALSLHYMLDRQPPDFAMELLIAADGRDRHWFRFLATGGRKYLLEPWLESLFTDLKVPLDVVVRDARRVRARRFRDPWDSVDIPVPADHVHVASVADPILVVRAGKKYGKAVTREDIATLVNVVDLDDLPSSHGDKITAPVQTTRPRRTPRRATK